jgi:hypothetical protein
MFLQLICRAYMLKYQWHLSQQLERLHVWYRRFMAVAYWKSAASCCLPPWLGCHCCSHAFLPAAAAASFWRAARVCRIQGVHKSKEDGSVWTLHSPRVQGTLLSERLKGVLKRSKIVDADGCLKVYGRKVWTARVLVCSRSSGS